MKKLWQFFIITFENSKIKYKLLIFVAAIMCVFFLFTIAGLQYAFVTYDEQIYRKSSQVLTISSDSVENELQRIQDITFEIVTNPVLVQNAMKAKAETNRYEQYEIQTAISNELSTYVSLEKHIHSIYLIDENSKVYAAGNTQARPSETEKVSLIKRAQQHHGSNVWIEEDGTNRFLTTVRQMRSYEALSMEPLSTVVVRVDLEKIVRELPEDWEDTAANMIISDGENVFFSEGDIDAFDSFHFSVPEGQGYTISKIDGQRYFITYVKTPFENWTYWNIISFDAVFAGITTLKYSIMAAFIVLLGAVSFIIVHFTRKITNPIEQLASAMKQMQRGDFTVAASMPAPGHQDEIGSLHRDFTTMAQRIDELIKENYEKQLLLKETEFKALQAQMNPHFLYNTLQSVNWLAKINKQQQISKMVESLAYLLRNSVNVKEDIVTIQQEIDLVHHYVTIQKYRFEERLDFSVEAELEVVDCQIPKLTIQPLIENAIHYALEKLIEPCSIKVKVFRQNAHVIVQVTDNGPGMDEEFLKKLHKGEVKTRGTGIGLRNIHERTRLFFGESYGLTVQSKQGEGTAIIILLPYKMGRENNVQSAAGR